MQALVDNELEPWDQMPEELQQSIRGFRWGPGRALQGPSPAQLMQASCARVHKFH